MPVTDSTRLTLAGRFNYFSSTHLGPVTRFYGRVHRRLYDRFQGTRFATLFGDPVLELTVPGRRSGVPRPVMLMQIRSGDALLICGSNGGNPGTPNWWKNLVAAPDRATVRIGRETFPVTVRFITDEAEYETLWSTLTAGYSHFDTYRALSSRHFPMAALTRVRG
ncbi:nitroreductase/quinone reductase family protein [Nocardia seriolae]|uniref:F420H(2)-dependent quinone reductase n=1 Tax=Nocardia seriolae TaxID=37332 RepID=A0A0B8NEC3_9NOCA|nr:nitroreductase/quinone reductase family protein [Nocardia seriolae]APA97697.1 F420H(2)-dependent quinone reductase [Nocardia seriolae]MTJ62576.1 nitroreductase family deazaflavin-dependent oxidoreductase [Nocardia seriolae]MTJ71996.1 nitroreductase family deazaflavin-dependent oxidoreductase [Nocardia seriolae]MTJ87473.1 nitroreductase family deazaflavin-dependent oxidoreductase [Nocardia seriolae]MTK31464.1 nitroreductase family deazaflavin-dependent oxidoreductase [Nocardia seriolae]